MSPSPLAEGRLRVLIEGLSTAALLEDEQRRVLQVNTRYCDLFAPGANPSDLEGTDCSRAAERVMHLMVSPHAFVAGVERLLANQQPVNGELVELIDGRVLERDYMPVTLDGKMRGHFWNYRDVSQQHRLLDELKAAKDDADRSNNGKDLFVAALSHELRSQLHSMLGNLELLRETHLDEGQLGLLRSVRYAARSQLALIGDLLDLSALRAGTFSLDPAPFTLKTIAGDVVASQSEVCKVKGIDLSLELDPRLPERLHGDARRFGQVLTNLLANAVRHCDKGHVRVQIIRAATSGASLLLRLEVEDTGPGVAPEDEAGLFTPFHRANDPARRRGGTGLGLAICRQLVEAMGGMVGYFPTSGGGATFWFTARFDRTDNNYASTAPSSTARVTGPLVRSPSTSSLAAVRPMTATSLSQEIRRTVLVVEDTPTSRIWAKRVLESRGYEVVDTSGGQEALDLLETRSVDLILMDWQMPGMDGLETTRRIRKRGGEMATIPILGLSANASPNDLKTCLEAGMNGCLFKPVSIVDLTTRIKEMLVASQTPAPSASTSQPPAYASSPTLRPILRDTEPEVADGSTHAVGSPRRVSSGPPKQPTSESVQPSASGVEKALQSSEPSAPGEGEIRSSKITGPLAGLPLDVVRELVELFQQGTRDCRRDLEAALDTGDNAAVRKVLHKLVGMTGNLGHASISSRLRSLHERVRVEILARPLEEELRAAMDMACAAADAQFKRYGF